MPLSSCSKIPWQEEKVNEDIPADFRCSECFDAGSNNGNKKCDDGSDHAGSCCIGLGDRACRIQEAEMAVTKFGFKLGDRVVYHPEERDDPWHRNLYGRITEVCDGHMVMTTAGNSRNYDDLKMWIDDRTACRFELA